MRFFRWSKKQAEAEARLSLPQKIEILSAELRREFAHEAEVLLGTLPASQRQAERANLATGKMEAILEAIVALSFSGDMDLAREAGRLEFERWIAMSRSQK